MQTAYEIGRANALEALDQAPGLMAGEPDYYRSLSDVTASYWDNVNDTLAEVGLATDEAVRDAERGFAEALREATAS